MIPLSKIRTIEQELSRPECVLATANGRLYASSWRGGVSVLEPDGSQWELMARDSDHLVWAEAAYREGNMGRPHLDQAKSTRLRNISSMAFACPGLKTAYPGCLLDSCLYQFDAPVAGHPPSHWQFDGPGRTENQA